ncbi:MAG: hypothetical protein VKK42_22240 [Lyngbya sp.]|nr:hypothetical protein [Lyngbya sp.]
MKLIIQLARQGLTGYHLELIGCAWENLTRADDFLVSTIATPIQPKSHWYRAKIFTTPYNFRIKCR